MYNSLVNKEKKLAVIGLGYVGLPIALEFAKKISVIGFDINADRIQLMREGIDPSKELEKEAFNNCDIEFTNSLDKLREANFQRQQLQKRVAYLEELNEDMKAVADANKKLEGQIRRIGELESKLNMVAEERDELARKQINTPGT